MRILSWAVVGAATLLAVWPGHVAAQSPAAVRWVFVPVVTDGAELPAWSAAAVDALSEAASAERVAVLGRVEAASEFERRHSRKAVPVTGDDVRTLQRLAAAALRSIAAADHKTALTQLEAAARQYDLSPDEYNREDPKLVLDLCLFRARALLETATSPANVKEEIRECRLRIPLEVDVDLMKHTNVTVRRLLADVMGELMQQRNGTLEVHSADGCQIRVDGVPIGRVRDRTFVTHDIIRGTHRVSAVCNGMAGRTHTLKVSEVTPTVIIDPMFERAVESRPLLHLRLSTLEAASAPVGLVLAAALGPRTMVVTVRQDEGGKVILESTRSDGKQLRTELEAPLHLGSPWTREQCAAAIRALLAAPVAPISTPTAQLAAKPAASVPALMESSELRRTRRAGISLLIAGGSTAAGAFGAHFKARHERAQDEAAYNRLAPHGSPKGERSGEVSLALSLSASFLIMTGTQELLLNHFGSGRRMLLPLAASGTTGVVMLSLGIWQQRLAHGACHQCLADQHNARELSTAFLGLGAALASASVFTAVLIRATRPDRRAPDAQISAGLGTLQLTGSF